jgi:glucose/arabinose dehydrogenase
MTRMITWKRAGALLACASVLTLAGCDDNSFDVASQIGPNPKLPEPQQYLFPPMKLAPIAGWKDGETPKVPQGLQVTALATGLQHPRSVYTLPNGDVLIVESKKPPGEPVKRPKDLVMGFIESFVTSGGASNVPSNRITLVRDANGDGKPELRTTFLDHLNSPFGVALVGNDLYVANTDAIMHYTYHTGDTKITEPGTVLTPLPGGPIDHHWTKSLVASRDGSLLYVGVGSNSNITENGMEAEKNRAAIWEVNRQTGASRLYATGLRNPNGLSLEPETGALWAVINERDELGPNLVPDYMTSVKDGAFYGWPYSYYGQHVDPRVHPQRPDLVAKAIPPDYALSSHVAPLGMVFDTGDSLPAKYKGGAFVGEHGSWDRQHFNGYKVVFVPFSGGKPNGKAEDVVTGFLNGDGKARGRPVGLALDKSGALLIADDVGNTVWRVAGTAPQTASGTAPAGIATTTGTATTGAMNPPADTSTSKTPSATGPSGLGTESTTTTAPGASPQQ